jgi:copper chaperone CopZ
MKSLRFFFVCLFSFGFVGLFAQEKTDSFTVYGNCGMCKSRIDKAAKLEGVTAASWNKDTKVLTVTYEASKVNNEAIQKKVASVGHDTELFTASDKVYDKLPGCCKYERKAASGKN